MLCNEFLTFNHKKQKRPLSILGLNVFLQVLINLKFYQYSTRATNVFFKLLILLIKIGGGGGS